jgi:hypothetical protein
MKAILVIAALLLSGIMLKAQNKFAVKSLPNADVLNQYPTRDEKGNTLELLAAVQVALNQKECDANGIPLYLKCTDKKEYIRPALYCWNAMLRSWRKYETPQKSSQDGNVVYSALVRCPGVYAFLDAASQTEKGVLVSMPSKCSIRSIKLIQQSPAYSVLWEGNGTNEVKIPFGELQFDAVMELTWEEAGITKKASYLCGALTRVDEAVQAGEFRKLEIKPGKTVEFQSTLFTNNSN